MMTRKDVTKIGKIRGVRVKIEKYQLESSEDWSASKRDGNDKNKMRKIHGNEVSQVRRNKNNKLKKNT